MSTIINNLSKAFFLIFITISANTQITQIVDLPSDFNKALIERNILQLEYLLHPALIYGHSNGWKENKTELINNNQSGFLKYEAISIDSLEVNYVDEHISIIRFNGIHQVSLNGKNLSLNLHVSQTWIKSNGLWKLISRQSVRLN
jgi:hypothetical protein